MDAVLRPHRSLSVAAFKWMLIAVIAVNAVVASVFVAPGAFPVAGFLGLDVLALWLAFRWNYRAARATEYVRVAPGKVHVASISAAGSEAHDGEGQMRVGAFLSPKECESFAVALDAALHRARCG